MDQLYGLIVYNVVLNSNTSYNMRIVMDLHNKSIHRQDNDEFPSFNCIQAEYFFYFPPYL